MSRSGYSDDIDDPRALNLWRGAVESAIKGGRGQAFLKELANALDAMPEKKLVTEELEVEGEFCTLGVIGKARGIRLSDLDTENWNQLSKEFGIAKALAREIMYENDFYGTHWPYDMCNKPAEETAKERWVYMRNWVQRQIK